MGLNSDMGERIVSSILAHYRFPDQTFVGSPETVDALKQALDQERQKASAGLTRDHTGASLEFVPKVRASAISHGTTGSSCGPLMQATRCLAGGSLARPSGDQETGVTYGS